jgi:metal-responsive CopG/Arc/MetJ family transcriptional regulator
MNNVRFLVSIDKSVLQVFDIFCKQNNSTRSGYIKTLIKKTIVNEYDNVIEWVKRERQKLQSQKNNILSSKLI